MNLRLKDRIGLAVYSLCGMGAAVLTGYLGYLLFTGRVSVRVPLLGYVGSVFGSFAVAIIMLVYSLCMLRLALRRKSKKDRNSVAVQNTQQGNGEVRVSLQALDALVKQAIAAGAVADAPKPVPAAKKETLVTVLRYSILGIALIVLIGGFLFGGTADVLAKAAAICTECVGLG